MITIPYILDNIEHTGDLSPLEASYGNFPIWRQQFSQKGELNFPPYFFLSFPQPIFTITNYGKNGYLNW